MKIEELNEGEHVQVSKMLVDLWGEPNSLRKARSYLLNGYKSAIKEDKFFVIKENKKVIGVISLVIFSEGVAEIEDFIIKKEERGKGYGSQLLDFVINYVKSKGVRKLSTLSYPEAKEFYEKKGFIEEGHLKDHQAEGEDTFFMSLKFKKEKQVDLKSQLEKLDVEKKAEEKLLNLPVK